MFQTACQDGKAAIGFYRAASHTVCPVSHCLLLRNELNDALAKLWHNPPAEGPITVRVGSGCEDVVGCQLVEEELDGLVFQISRASFFQVNYGAALLLYRKAREYAALSLEDVLVDIYCGVGSLTLFIGRDAGLALGVESNPVAVEDALANARRNKLSNVRFDCADAAKWDARIEKPACVVVDPPRRGLSAGAARKIQELSPERIVYISCDPATLARDIKRLTDYEAQRISVFDMFPRTANVECCLLLIRKERRHYVSLPY